jgi:hypothetical protein
MRSDRSPLLCRRAVFILMRSSHEHPPARNACLLEDSSGFRHQVAWVYGANCVALVFSCLLVRNGGAGQENAIQLPTLFRVLCACLLPGSDLVPQESAPPKCDRVPDSEGVSTY